MNAIIDNKGGGEMRLVEEYKTEEESILDKEFNSLKRRIRLTRSARIEASKRLRKKHDFLEKVSYFYSLIILILSVWFLNQSGESANLITKLLLVLSLSLTFFSMFLNIKNYKERAGNFEENYQQLDVLLNKLDRKKANEEIDIKTLKELHREYEKLNIGKENHLNIDYYTSSKDKKEFKKQILLVNIKNKTINIMVAIYPILLLIVIYYFDKLKEFFL